ncbi:Peptidase M8 [Trypanosoma melophagium]|uniref:Peptidase M8 n=1 Tax=Trypanosoma melophagium TaxID=715481 RepID=UPI00351A4A91|nr:Peptidase M8 [Trypanosoma melophagium]
MPGSRVGETSRCLDGNGIVLKGGASAGHVVGDVCANVKCEGGQVHVQYKGDEEWHLCPAGGSIELGGKSVFSSGRIVCPPKEEVCTGLHGAVLPGYKEQDEKKEGGDDAIAATADAVPFTLNSDHNTASGGSSGKNTSMDGSHDTSSAKQPKGSTGINTNDGAKGNNNERSNIRVTNPSLDNILVKALLWTSLACVAAMASVLLVP